MQFRTPFFKKVLLLLVFLLSVLSCATKNIAYKPGLPITIKPDPPSGSVRVGEFRNNLGYQDPKKITSAMTLSRNVSEVVQDAVVKELEYCGINTAGGDLLITGEVNRLDPLRLPDSVAHIIYHITDPVGKETIETFSCKSGPSAHKLEAAIKDCMVQFFSVREVQLALGLEVNNAINVANETISSNPTESDKNYNRRETVRFVQQALNERGYQVGVCDGWLGDNTRRSLNQFQQDCALPVSRQINESTLSFLKNPQLINDTKPPRIRIDRRRGIGVVPKEKEHETIAGYVTDESTVRSFKIDDRTVFLNENGEFNEWVSLRPGNNKVVIAAIDEHGNQEKKEIKIKREQNPLSHFSKESVSEKTGGGFTPGRYYALLIAVEDYNNNEIEDLDHALTDTQKLKQIIEDYYTFESSHIRLLENPSRSEIIDAFDKLSQELTLTDNLLIFFAGHGYWDQRFEQGYWLPSDARKSSKAEWISNSTIRDFIGGINTKHTLLIADACFGGGIFKTRKAFESDRVVKELYSYPSRKAMTSGNLTEVPDKSAFMKYLLKRLQNNSEKYLPSEGLFASFKIAVIRNSPIDQIPKFGEIHNAGDEGGDFIFVHR
jgi:hypothetical protein